MAYNIKWGRHAQKYIKKLKEKKLKQKFLDAVYDDIAEDPYKFDSKTGDLSGYFAYGFKYKGTEYRIAYSINDSNEVVIIILTGTHEMFYEQLKRIIKN